MSKLLQSITISSLRHSRMMDVKATTRASGRRGYGKSEPEGTYESGTPSFVFRVPRRLRIVMRLGSRRVAAGTNNKVQQETSANSVEVSSKTIFVRIRLAYERMMLRAASKSGEVGPIPVAKASRAPPALSSVVSTHPVWSAFGSGIGAKVSDLDPGFKLTAAEKKYLKHLNITASSGRFAPIIAIRGCDALVINRTPLQ